MDLLHQYLDGQNNDDPDSPIQNPNSPVSSPSRLLPGHFGAPQMDDTMLALTVATSNKKKQDEGENDNDGDNENGGEIENPASEAWLVKNKKSPWAGKKEGLQGELTEEQKKYTKKKGEENSGFGGDKVSRSYIWAYACFQFAIVFLFAHVFYTILNVSAILSVLLSSFTGFGISISMSSLLMEYIRWRTRRQIQSSNQNVITTQRQRRGHAQPQQEHSGQHHQLQRLQQVQHQ